MNTSAMTHLSIWKWGLLGIAAVFASGCQTHEREFHTGCTDPGFDSYDPLADVDDGNCCDRKINNSQSWDLSVTDTTHGDPITVDLDLIRVAIKLEGPCTMTYDTDQGNFFPYSETFDPGCDPVTIDHWTWNNWGSARIVRTQLDSLRLGRWNCAAAFEGIGSNANYLNIYTNIIFYHGSDSTHVFGLNVIAQEGQDNAIGIPTNFTFDIPIDSVRLILDSLVIH